jgi:tRNA threonylcarbamoyladenosine biosynthesis protein TsaE
MVDTRRQKQVGKQQPYNGQPTVAQRTVFSLSEEETIDLGRSIGRALKGGELVLLDGDLGLGKTVFARGIAAGLGVDPEDVASPSFTLVREYRSGRLPMFHVDLYRIDEADEIGTLGIEEIVAAGGVVVVEWGDKLPPYLKRGATIVRIYDLGEGSRRLEIATESKSRGRPRGDA